jgi:hypothetical protein
MLTDEQFADIKFCASVLDYVRNLPEAKSTTGFFDEPIDRFIAIMRMFNPQSYGSRIEKRIIHDGGFISVAGKDKGDCRDGLGDHYEVKASIITNYNPVLNLVQLRPWQDIKGYLCIAFDVRVEPMGIEVYRLDINQMKSECELLHATSAHGTQEANRNNENIELALRVPMNKEDANYIRWQRYRSTFSFNR